MANFSVYDQINKTKIVTVNKYDTIRSFDGSANNLTSPTLGKITTNLIRTSNSAYVGSQTAGVAERGASNPSPRLISNEICQASLYTRNPVNELGLTDITWTWGLSMLF